MGFFSKLLSVGESKPLKNYQRRVAEVNAFEPAMQARSDEELAHLTVEFRERLANGEDLDDLLPEAFAAVREASVRTIGLRHFDVQLIGAMALNDGKIAEMRTGEGKTLVSTLAGYLNALPGNNVHIVTVNDYLAARDSQWMGRIYRFMGMNVGLIQNGMGPEQKIPAYQADVTYGTNSEFGFDYLRDNMVARASRRVQRGHSFAIVDEVDSILIDEARTPLIISGAGSQAADTYKRFAAVMPSLKRDVDFEMDEAKRTIYTTEAGLEKVEFQLGIEDIFSDPTGQLPNHLQQALKAQFLFHRDVDYVVVNGEVKIVDEFTGRIMEGRRYSEGLHQALEAKEHVLVRQENQTLATITLQNYFRLYDKLSGMTGTAMTEDSEFRQIYNLPVMSIPPNREVQRIDEDDLIYRTVDAKFNAVADDIAERHAAGQPCLVGTVSIESSERLSRLLSKRGIKHEVLNAKNHEREAAIVAQAGRTGAVTIATNMAGRGTDIMLGGNSEFLAKRQMRKLKYTTEEIEDASAYNETDDEKILTLRKKYQEIKNKFDEEISKEKEKVVAVGGLKIIGTSRHESRRIDNQLRGRSGRQGDPGESRFYLSLDDDLMKIFGGDAITKVYNTLGADEDLPIESKLISRAVENAQKKVESRNFSIRKNVLQYDDVMNVQRTIIYKQRREVLDGENIRNNVLNMVNSVIDEIVGTYCSDPLNIQKEALIQEIETDLGITQIDALKEKKIHVDKVTEELKDKALKIYEEKEQQIGEKQMRELERIVVLKIVDNRWMDHIDNMDELKDGIGLRAYGQKDPVVQYRTEGSDMFEQMVYDIKSDVVKLLMNARKREDTVTRQESVQITNATLANSTIENVSRDNKTKKQAPSLGHIPVVNQGPKVGRNDPCPCGSGKKYKNCCGRDQ